MISGTKAIKGSRALPFLHPDSAQNPSTMWHSLVGTPGSQRNRFPLYGFHAFVRGFEIEKQKLNKWPKKTACWFICLCLTVSTTPKRQWRRPSKFYFLLLLYSELKVVGCAGWMLMKLTLHINNYCPANKHNDLLQKLALDSFCFHCLVTKLHPTLCDPMDYIACLCPWVSQARILEWVAISFSRGSSCPKDQTRLFHLLNWQVDFFYPLANSSLMLFVKCELGGSELCSTLLWIVRKKDVVSYHELGGREEHKWCEQPGLLPPVPSPSCHHHHPNNWCRYWGLTMGQDRNLSLYMCYLTTLSQLCKVEGIVSPHFWIETVTRQLAQCPS